MVNKDEYNIINTNISLWFCELNFGRLTHGNYYNKREIAITLTKIT